MNIDWRKYLAQMAFVLALFGAGFVMLFLFGCASQSTGVRTNHRVEKHQVHVVIPATAEASASIVPVTNTVEIWEDEQTKTESTSGPDMKQIAPAVAAVAGAVATGGTAGGTGGLALLTTAGLTLAAYVSREVMARKDANKQATESQARIDRLREDRDRHLQRAEEYALRLPPDEPRSAGV
jgi:hypothetical protein